MSFIKYVLSAFVAALLLAQPVPLDAQPREPNRLTTEFQSEPDTLFARLLNQYSYPMALTDQQFSGIGWTKLQAAIKASQFVLIGEDHGTTQIPVLTAAVADVLNPKQYVAEIDSYTAQVLSELVKKPGLPIAHQRRYFQGLSFYSWREEYQLLQELEAKKIQLVGIEQINYGFAGQFFTLLADQTKQAATKAYLQQQAKTYQATFETCMRQHTYMRPSEQAMDSLQMMTKSEGPAVRKMVSDFVTSNQIYQARSGGHQERINLMKHNLLETLKPYLAVGEQALPTMLFKFGANHMARNLSVWSSVFDVGNLVVNLADAQGKKSLHLMVMGKQGTKAGYTDIDNLNKDVRESYSATSYPFLSPFFDRTTTQWQVFDLRPMRRAVITDKLQLTDQYLEATVLGYDYLIIIPETTGSRAF